MQTLEEYDNYACDLTTYNSKFFLDKGAEKYDPMDISPSTWSRLWATPTRRSSRTTPPALVRHWTGCWLSWTPTMLPSTHTPVNYKGNKHFQNPCSHSYYYVGMTQWRDTGTETNTDNNMWPYTVRLLQQKAVEKVWEYIYGARV